MQDANSRKIGRCAASNRPHGLSLVEVLVALVIVAVTLLAAMRLTANATVQSNDYRDRLLARWVASNVLARVRLEPALPAIGERSGDEMQAGVRLPWRLKIVGTPNPRFRRLEIEVGPAGAALATLTGFKMQGGE